MYQPRVPPLSLSLQVMSFIESNVHYIGGAALGLALIELLGIIMACCLAKALHWRSLIVYLSFMCSGMRCRDGRAA